MTDAGRPESLLPGYVRLARDIEAIGIPDGKPVPMTAGTPVKLTQALGTSYTVQTERGAKFRINGRDGDAIAQPVLGVLGRADVPQDAAGLEKLAREQLHGVYDPEIPVDIIELGLVHSIKVAPHKDAGGAEVKGAFDAEVRMGLTSPGCGMGDVLQRDVEAALRAIPGIVAVDAKVVLFPVWNPYTMMSEAAKLKLGML